MEFLSIRKLSVLYDGRSVLSDFNLSVAKGDKILIKGRSGIGKSTLFRIIMGFSVQDSGTISIEGVPVNADTVWDLRKRIAYVSQDTDIAHGKVKYLIDEVFSFKANKDILDRAELEKILSYLSLTREVLNKEYMRLSGGEKQRIVLLLALLSGKDIFLLDEVTAELDSALKQKVVDIFLKNPEWTVISISHDREWENEHIKIIDFSEEN